MSIDEQIVDLFNEFGITIADDLKDSVVQALADGGRKNPQTVKLDFKLNPASGGGNVTITIQAVNGERGVDYWKVIDKGRRAGAKQPPSDVLGKKWQNMNNIDPRVILKSLKRPNKKLKSKEIPFDKAAKTLSFLLARSIKKKGIKPKPFVDRVLNDGRIEEFKRRLTPLLGEKFKLQIMDITH